MTDRGKQYRSQFRFTLGEQTYEYRGHLSAADALLIKRHTGMGSLEMLTAIGLGDPAAVVALVFITKRQAGEKVTWEEVVDQIDGDDDMWSLFASIEPIKTDEAPAAKVDAELGDKPTARKTRTKKESDPATA